MKLILFVGLMVALDILTAREIKKIFPKFGNRYQRSIRITFVIQTILALSIVLGAYFMRGQIRDYHWLAACYYMLGFMLAIYLPKALFALFLLADRLISALRQRSRRKQNLPARQERRFLAKCGLIVALLWMALMVWGILFGRYNYKIEPVEIFFDNLPQAFDGYKIVQISDTHAGSYGGNVKHFEKAVALINAQNPDIIVFTGDLVNNFSEELIPLTPVFSQLQAKEGKYAVLGNHDYGGYYRWKSSADSVANQAAIERHIAMMGFELLKNEAVVFSRNNTEQIALIGVENWGRLKRFPKRADIETAMQPVANIPFKLLLSHDPAYWEENIKGKTDIALTLSGHSHGMQMGIKLGQKRLSPAHFLYRHWSGLYAADNQYLYVNRGLGVVVFPGRIGMSPEITVITLRKEKKLHLHATFFEVQASIYKKSN